LLSKIGLTTTLKNAWTTSRQVNFFWVANFNLKFGVLFVLVGFGTIIHSMVDYTLALAVYKVLRKRR
ncbi:TPA: hypothetical protein VVR01_001132, partial [Streptococcus pneumoniae]|nr:hypothetical protein [Streptococcus pneumoniae]